MRSYGEYFGDAAAPQPPHTLTSEDFEHLAGFFSKHTESRGTVLTVPGRPCPRLLVIKQGVCKVFKSYRAGSQLPQELGELGIGQVLGAASHILGQAGEHF